MGLYLVKILIDLSQGRLNFEASDSQSRIPSMCKTHLKECFSSTLIDIKAIDPKYCFRCSSMKLKRGKFTALPSVFQAKAVRLLKVTVGPQNPSLMLEANQLNTLIFDDLAATPPDLTKCRTLNELPLHRDMIHALQDFITSFKDYHGICV